MQRPMIGSLVSGVVAAAVTLGIVGLVLGLLTSEFGILLAIGAAAMVGIVTGGVAYLSMNGSSN
jgi:hypothetical protein